MDKSDAGKLNNHLVDNTKSKQAWNQWLVSSRGKTVKLLIFEYGLAISKAKDLEQFWLPASDLSIRIVLELQQNVPIAKLQRS
ncbi:hypothetical protein F441_07116 [Phytophthora nicotianae CJ01A1]|uniref:Uncharacterized protein n=2 Tax=Phytophthora nicotianae TaxID=4792 RepID=W2GEU6_PHYNI|nr:hypothetical protein L915_13644 [Phytophthora nicotianae]ETL34195.1 hypothetical protein L916_13539 [Phytophthora nicotianae]ETP18696.1 hypothetical protein F441_07116 [Phytophthora nicotianae CJ01A1]